MKFVKYGNRKSRDSCYLCVDNFENPHNFEKYSVKYNNGVADYSNVPEGYIPLDFDPIYEMEIQFVTPDEIIDIHSGQKFSITKSNTFKLLNLIASREVKISDENHSFIGKFGLNFVKTKSKCEMGITPIDRLDIL